MVIVERAPQGGNLKGRPPSAFPGQLVGRQTAIAAEFSRRLGRPELETAPGLRSEAALEKHPIKGWG
jgi:hypothetical protein